MPYSTGAAYLNFTPWLGRKKSSGSYLSFSATTGSNLRGPCGHGRLLRTSDRASLQPIRWRRDVALLRRVRSADDQRADELRRLRHRRPLEPRHLESFGLDRGEGGPVAVALDDQAIQPVHPVLEAREMWVVGAHVLEE